MSVTTFPVTVGPQNIMPNGLAPGTMLQNSDLLNAVWITTNPNPQPGIGLKLNPQASITVSKQVPLYACVDTGVSQTVTLLIATSLADLNDPVAVADALFLSGIVTSYKTTLIDGAINLAGGGGVSAVFDIHDFSSLELPLVSSGGGTLNLFFSFCVDAAGANVVTSFSVPNANSGATFPAYADYLFITNNGTASVALALYGSTRPSTGLKVATSDNGQIDALVFVNPAAGTNLMGTWFGYGPSTIYLGCNTAAIKGLWQLYDGFNAIPIGDTNECHLDPYGNNVVYKNINVKQNPLNEIQFLCQTVAAGNVLARRMGYSTV